jgi:hypothetical protein
MELLNFQRVILFRSTQEKNLLIVLFTVQKPYIFALYEQRHTMLTVLNSRIDDHRK